MSEALNDLPLGDNIGDRTASLVKGGIGALPFVGSILAEIVSQFIPNQRLERIENYLRALNEKISQVENVDQLGLTQPENIDLIEDGGFQAARALSPERLRHIVSIVSEGLAGDERQRLESKRLLRILGEIDDEQLIILSGELLKNRHDPDFGEHHRDVLAHRMLTIGAPQEQVDDAAIRGLTINHLMRLGLLEEYHPFLKKDRLPEYDTSGKLKGAQHRLAPGGRLLLRALGLAEAGEY
jgi:hypothetical protein